ncbi:MAG TPA: hypothetical protein VJ877_06095, partial [Bacteroidales bacterium]|nr:hypothetical protein [Bacteroidales bacterium]
MRPYLITILLIISCTMQTVHAQSPHQLNYQAVVRDASGNIIPNADIAMKISILQGGSSGSAVCTEEFFVTSNDYGLVKLKIGSNNPAAFEVIDWTAGPYFIKTEIDDDGDAVYTEMGTSQMLSVPYAMYATTAGNTTGDSLWRQSEDNLYYNEGKIGVGTSTPLASLSVQNEDLPTTAGSRIDWLRLSGDVTNTDNLYVYNRRHEDGSNWNSSEVVLQKQVDATPMHFISFMGSQGNSSFLKFGYHNTTHLSLAENGNFGIGVDNPEASLDVNGSIRTNSGSGTVLYGNTNPFGIPEGDGYRIRWDPSWLATNMDALIFEKTDFNSIDPDGAIAFVNTGNDGVENHTLTVRGNGRVGVGTSSPVGKLGVETESTWSDEVPLFEVKNSDGTPVFAVYNNGVRILVEDDPAKKGAKGGFAIGGFDPT